LTDKFSSKEQTKMYLEYFGLFFYFKALKVLF
jgi:hypothetical protein